MNQINITSDKVLKTKSPDFLQMVEANIIAVTYYGKIIYRATIKKPEHKVVKKITYTEFSHTYKATLKNIIKRGSVEVVCGYGKNKEKSFYITK